MGDAGEECFQELVDAVKDGHLMPEILVTNTETRARGRLAKGDAVEAARRHRDWIMALAKRADDETLTSTGCRLAARFVASHLMHPARFGTVVQHWMKGPMLRVCDIRDRLEAVGRGVTPDTPVLVVLLLNDQCVDRLYHHSESYVAAHPKEAAATFLDDVRTRAQFTHMWTVIVSRPRGGGPLFRFAMGFSEHYTLADYLGCPPSDSDASIERSIPVLRPLFREASLPLIASSPYRRPLTWSDMASCVLPDLATIVSSPVVTRAVVDAYARLFCADMSAALGQPGPGRATLKFQQTPIHAAELEDVHHEMDALERALFPHLTTV